MKIFMRTIILVLLIINSVNNIFCQTNCDSAKTSYVLVEKPPKLNYKLIELEQLLNSNIKIDNYKLNDHITKDKAKTKSKCLLFNINCKGEMYNFKAINIKDSLFVDNLIDFVKKNCTWQPGFQNGEVIDFSFSLCFDINNGMIKIINNHQIE
jgi:hypothetical protein